MNNGLIGKVVIVTGGSQGIGRATAERFAEESACVVLSDTSDAVVSIADAFAASVSIGLSAAKLLIL